MSLISDLSDIKRKLDGIEKKAARQQMIYFDLITAMVAMHQEHRVAKNFTVSDQIRSALNSCGIEIIQGTAGYEYGSIPEALKGRPVGDTWRVVH